MSKQIVIKWTDDSEHSLEDWTSCLIQDNYEIESLVVTKYDHMYKNGTIIKQTVSIPSEAIAVCRFHIA